MTDLFCHYSTVYSNVESVKNNSDKHLTALYTDAIMMLEMEV